MSMRSILTVLAVAAPLLSGYAAQAQTPPSFMPPISITDPGAEGVRVAADGVFANYFAGKGAGRRPAILLLGGSEGGIGPGSTRMAKSLAAEGFSVLQLCYFGCPGTSSSLVSVPLETFSAGLAWLRARPDVAGDRIGVVGGSKGAEAALVVAARHPELKAVAVGMPSNVSWPGISYTNEMKPSWTEGGAPVPYLPYALSALGKGVFSIYADALPAVADHPDGVIAVEKITGPILLVCGEADSLWPSCPMTDQIAARLSVKGRPAPTILRYADAGHALFGVPVDPANPTYQTLGSLGGTPDGNAAARADDWPKTVAFLKAALGE